MSMEADLEEGARSLTFMLRHYSGLADIEARLFDLNGNLGVELRAVRRLSKAEALRVEAALRKVSEIAGIPVPVSMPSA